MQKKAAFVFRLKATVPCGRIYGTGRNGSFLVSAEMRRRVPLIERTKKEQFIDPGGPKRLRVIHSAGRRGDPRGWRAEQVSGKRPSHLEQLQPQGQWPFREDCGRGSSPHFRLPCRFSLSAVFSGAAARSPSARERWTPPVQLVCHWLRRSFALPAIRDPHGRSSNWR